MKTIYKSSIFGKKKIVKTFNKDFREDTFKEEIINVDNESGKGYFKELKLDGIRITIRDFKTKYHEINVVHDFPYFKLHFEIEGASLYTPFDSLEKSVDIPGGHYNLFYLPQVNGLLSYDTNYRKTVEIVFTEKYIKRILGDDFKNELQNFGNAIIEKKSFLMWNESKPITPEILNSIQNIIDCKFTGSLKKAYIETKVNELLIVLLAKTNDKDTISDIPACDFSKMLLVREYIKSNLSKTLTISELALFAGVNTSKLKQDFKRVFASTIFKYVTKLRMEKARELILENQFSITEVAYKVGYKHSQHFTVAFKKLYGHLPSKLIKN